MIKTKIDWCDSTWNPVTGCLHECEYYYARGIANRFGFGAYEPDINERILLEMPISAGKKVPYPFNFEPTFHKYRLDEYQNKKGRNIFVCSMADLFGDWMPDEWIEEVFEACGNASQHNYLFLTKNPERYISLEMSGKLPKRKNMWYGITVANVEQAEMADIVIEDMPGRAGAFLSIEPILEDVSKRLKDTISNFVDWVIIGAETGKRKSKIAPEREWIEDIVNECKKAKIPIFMKSSLEDIWGEPLIQEFPEELKKCSRRNNGQINTER